jgi:hypothetical protein
VKRFLRYTAVLSLISVVGGAAVCYIYWRSLSDTPQYSLALLVDAARTGDQVAVEKLVDSDAVVDDFVPQVVSKAVDLYGRGLPEPVIAGIAAAAGPLMPAVKERTRAELPSMIRRETERFADVPFALLVMAADRYLDIAVVAQTASVRSKIPGHGFEVKMHRNGTLWQIVSVRDDDLANEIAETIGQQIIETAAGGNLKKAAEGLGLDNVRDLIRRAEELLR